jgi:hypothetical protein
VSDTWAGLLKVVLDSRRMWAAAFAFLLSGVIAVAAKRYGFIDDVPPTLFYALVGLGLISGVFILTTGAQNLTDYVGARLAAARGQRWQHEFARKNFLLTGSRDREILLHYKGRNLQRFRARGGGEHLKGMVRQALLENDSFDLGAYVQHYRIPDVIWRLLDDPPPGWADNVEEIEPPEWEGGDARSKWE